MSLLLGAWTIGLILGLLGLGVFLSFRVFHFPDITADGSLTLGAAVSATLMVAGLHPCWATLAGFAAGMLAGAVTGILHTRFRIQGLVSGILTMTALYSVNLHVMGKSNVPLADRRTLASLVEGMGVRWIGSPEIQVWGWDVAVRDLVMWMAMLGLVAVVGGVGYGFFQTRLGTAMRAAGDNAQMVRALGAPVEWLLVLGLAMSNGLIALSGSLLAQYQGFADAQMGLGMVVWGLASVILGESLVGSRGMGFLMVGAIAGSVVFRLLVALALRWGLNPVDLKLVTAAFVFVALVIPGWFRKSARGGTPPS